MIKIELQASIRSAATEKSESMIKHADGYFVVEDAAGSAAAAADRDRASTALHGLIGLI